MSGHDVLVKRDYARGGWYARCIEAFCSWRYIGVTRGECATRAELHTRATS